MKIHPHTTIVLTTVSAAVMLVLFFLQASVAFRPDAAPRFSVTHTIVYGYGSSSSEAPVCGNGIKTSLEGCDDGDTTSGDGCSATCTVESGYECTGTTPSVCASVCGDGVKASDEACDDNNTVAADGCSATCTVETGYECTGSAPSACETTCGDGIKAASEACDDGDVSAGDGCSATCTVESGYSCTNASPSVCETGCGDGITAGIEQCDDEGESSTCNVDCTTRSCGDGKTNATAGETCDAGGGNGANGTCTVACLKTYCGDGVVQTPNGNGQNEACEQATDGTCTNTCTHATGIGYTPPPVTSSSAASRIGPPANCGNGVLETDKGEQCDAGRFNGLSPNCDRFCRSQFCGDNIVQKQNGEECEPARDADGVYVINQCGKVCTVPVCDDVTLLCAGGCRWGFQQCQNSSGANSVSSASASSSSSQSSDSFSSVADVQTAISDGIEEVTGPLSGDIASSSSSVQSLILPSGEIPVDTGSSSSAADPQSLTCGDGVMQESEACDNGAMNSDSNPDGCRLNCQKAYCGDAVQDSGEECDRGTDNNLLGNGCTPTCKISVCGNTILEPGEECDDGPKNSANKPSSCSTLCLLPRCSDGIIDPEFGEVCDNGTNNSGTKPDSCRLNCVPAHCGDRIVDSGEECDDGSKGSAVCSPSCKTVVLSSSVHSAASDQADTSDNAIPLFIFLLVIASIVVRKGSMLLR